MTYFIGYLTVPLFILLRTLPEHEINYLSCTFLFSSMSDYKNKFLETLAITVLILFKLEMFLLPVLYHISK